jgi:hypothetical protein
VSGKRQACSGSQRKRVWLTTVAVAGAIAAETVFMRSRGYNIGLKATVRCRDGHLFTTIWIPGASLKAIRLGTIRLQYCPVGRHFTVVRPLKDSELTDEVLAIARSHHDIRVP